MARLSFALLIMSVSSSAFAHEPCRECQPVRPRIDVIGPIGTNLPPSYRRTFNRPRFLPGKIAYLIAPSSQEAIAWHKAEHQCAYANNLGRIEPHYFYPKPWEALKVGPRATLASKKSSLQLVPLSETPELTPSDLDDVLDFQDDESASARSDMAPNAENGRSIMFDEKDSGSDQIMELPAPKAIHRFSHRFSQKHCR